MTAVWFAFLLIAAAACAAATNPITRCGGNGVYYDDIVGCQCYAACFSGPNCTTVDADCHITDHGGSPVLYQEYWANNPLDMADAERTFYRTPYQTANAFNATVGFGIQPMLRDAIVRLHQLAGNVVHPEGYNIVVGHGATQLIAASMWAINAVHGSTNVFSKTPFYGGYKAAASLGWASLRWNASEQQAPATIIEYVTTPSNPTGELRKPVYGNAAAVVHDCVYHWPSLVPDAPALDGDVLLFSMSKLTGHAGSRLGWAMVKDVAVAQKMAEFIATVQIHTSIDPQKRALRLLQGLSASPDAAGAFFAWVRTRMMQRWSFLQQLFANQSRFEVLSQPGTFYLWVKCADAQRDPNCYDTFDKQAGITTWAGPGFGATNAFTRLELVVSEAVWKLMQDRLTKLVKPGA